MCLFLGSFRDLSIATCICLLKALRSRFGIIEHFIHLCECVKFLHSKNIIHADLKLVNTFIRVLKRSEDRVLSVQLLLGDFDIAVKCNIVNNKMNTKGIDNKLATFGYHESIYNKLTSFQDMKKYKCDKYYKKYPDIYAGIDIFELGMIFLMMIYRINFNYPIIYWIKYEMNNCKVEKKINNNNNSNLNLNYNSCTVAHVLLYHKLEINTKYVETLKSSFSIFSRESSDFESKVIEIDFFRSKQCEYERTRHFQVIEDVQNKIIPTSLCNLLENMTCENPNQRISIQKCIEQLNSIKSNKLLKNIK